MKKVIFMGTPDFSVPILQSLIKSEYEVVLVVTQPDRPKGRKRELTPPPVKVEAMKHEIPIFQPEKLSTDYAEILTYDADIIITAAYGQLLPNEVLDYPEFGSINVHASLLPELRGGAPIHYAILQGKKETGITIMYMVEKLDAGDIISQERMEIKLTDHVGLLHESLAEIGAKLLLETLPQIFSRQITAIKQDEEKATFASNITREQERIDWSKTNLEVYNQIRGLHPWPVAYTTFNGERMKIWWSELDDKQFKGKTPGEIVEIIEDDSFIVVCGNNKGIKITSMQPSGKRRMETKDYLRGNPDVIKTGQILE